MKVIELVGSAEEQQQAMSAVEAEGYRLVAVVASHRLDVVGFAYFEKSRKPR